VRRGELWWARLPRPTGNRPVILLSREEAYSVRTRVTVVPLTTHVRGIPSEVRLGPSDGLPRAGAANADEIVTIPASLLDRRIALLKPAKMAEIEEAVRFALALDD